MPASALTVMDDVGVELRLDRPAQRVISLSPHLTELMYSIGAANRLVGVAHGSDFPAAAAALAQIGDASGLDFERILHLRADLVLAWGSGNRSVDIARLRSLRVQPGASRSQSLKLLRQANRFSPGHPGSRLDFRLVCLCGIRIES